MLPRFPDSAPLTVDAHHGIEQLTRRYAPYSDFNFVSLWCWDTDSSTRVSVLHDNLVVRFPGYNGRSITSVLGNCRPDATLIALLGQGGSEHGALHLVPRASLIGSGWSTTLSCTPDRDHFDYLYRLDMLSCLPGGRYREKRRGIRVFIRQHDPEFVITTPCDRWFQGAASALLARWQEAQPDPACHERERAALQRCLALDSTADLRAYGVRVDGELVAYAINERLSRRFCMGHFFKADPRYFGAGSYLLQRACNVHAHLGDRYINFEQDLGIPGLRAWKEHWHPIGFLRKYTITLRAAC